MEVGNELCTTIISHLHKNNKQNIERKSKSFREFVQGSCTRSCGKSPQAKMWKKGELVINIKACSKIMISKMNYVRNTEY